MKRPDSMYPSRVMGPNVTVSLTHDEALVLFEWLAREDDDKGGIHVEHPAEQRVLWQVQAYLEKTLTEPFAPDYDKLLAAARERVVAAEIR